MDNDTDHETIREWLGTLTDFVKDPEYERVEAFDDLAHRLDIIGSSSPICAWRAMPTAVVAGCGLLARARPHMHANQLGGWCASGWAFG